VYDMLREFNVNSTAECGELNLANVMEHIVLYGTMLRLLWNQ